MKMNEIEYAYNEVSHGHIFISQINWEVELNGN